LPAARINVFLMLMIAPSGALILKMSFKKKRRPKRSVEALEDFIH
jgi:hypothetical protein